MKKSFLKTAAVILVASFMVSGAFAASKKTKKEKKVKAKTILVGTGSSSPLYCYLDDNGELAGFEIDVIKAIDELLPQYEFKFEIFDFKNILLALAAGKIDIGAHMYESNPERRKNYLFTDYGYNDFSKYIVVLKENTNVKLHRPLQVQLQEQFFSTGMKNIQTNRLTPYLQVPLQTSRLLPQ